MLGFINLGSPMHILVILVVALLLFGSRLPEVARSMGRAINEFKRGLKDVEEDISVDDEPAEKKPKEKLTPPTSPGVARDRREHVEAEAEEKKG